ncbi:MAG: nitroreductase family protein [Nitrososphaerota archaeon]|nr:nitroreductase family protein [Nitrososphaerota archaeon]
MRGNRRPSFQESKSLCLNRAPFHPVPSLTPDELLTTTRAVRRRLDLSRPVERKVVEECVAIASQAPNAGNRQGVHFVVVADKDKRASLAKIYRKGSAAYFEQARAALKKATGNPKGDATMRRIFDSGLYLNEHLQEVPVHVIPCVNGRMEGQSVPAQAARWGSIFPAAWSFMLAGRARGLGMTFTTLHLNCEEEAAELLGIPYSEVTQAGLLPVAYYKGSRFKPASRPPLTQFVHWDAW